MAENVERMPNDTDRLGAFTRERRGAKSGL
jgi:hypothetical protein